MKSKMQRIRKYYSVPAKRGMKVLVQGVPGVIVGTKSHGFYLSIRLDGEKRCLTCHPVWAIEYPTEERHDPTH